MVLFFFSLDGCIFLGIERQKTLKYQIAKFLPLDQYSRKNIGYLFAIQHGARFIYDVDDNVVLGAPLSNLSFHLEPSKVFQMYNTTALVVNPCSHFGQKNLWLRGFPLEAIKDDPPDKFIQCMGVMPAVQQALINGVSDMDAIFYLTRREQPSTTEFYSKSNQVFLPNGTFAPLNSQNTLFHYTSLWGVLLPLSMTARVGDIWRGYITQRLLWEVGGATAILSANAFKEKKPRNLTFYLKEETLLYQKSLDLIKFLKNWQSSKTFLYDKAIDLYIALAKNELLDGRDAQLMEAWLHDLVSVGYVAPNISVTGNWVC